MSGEVLGGRYRVERELARGGMGKVLLVRDALLDREVAVKTMLAGAAADAQVRFLEEAQITGQLAHPNVVPVHELGWTGQEMFLAMKRVSGQDLCELIDDLEADRDGARERYPLGRLLRLFLKVCEAMAFAHERGVIHRDLKPANVMLGEGDEVLVMDWGLARPVGQEGAVVSQARQQASSDAGSGELTQEGAVVGTPAYMPPEQADGEPLDAAADVYALGATLYHLLTRQAPYSGSSIQVLTALFKGPPPRPRELEPGLPPALEAIVLKAMAPERGERYPDAEALAGDVEAFLDGRAVSAYQETAGEAVRRLLRRHWLPLVTAAAAAVLIAAGAAAAQAAVRSERVAADRAEARAEQAQRLTDRAAAEAARARARAAAVAEASAPIRAAAGFVLRCRGPLGLQEVLAEHEARVARPLDAALERLGELPDEDRQADAVAACRDHLASVRRAADRALVEVLLGRDPGAAGEALERLELGEQRPLLAARALLRRWRRREALAALEAAPPPKDAADAAASAALRTTLERAPLAEQRQAYARALRAVRPGEAAWLHGWLALRLGECLARLGELGSPDERAPGGVPATAHQAYALALSLTPNDPWIYESRVRHLIPINQGLDLERKGLATEVDRVLQGQRWVRTVWSGIMGRDKYLASGSDGPWKSFQAYLAETRERTAAGSEPLPLFVVLRTGAEVALILGKLDDAERFAREALAADADQPETLAVLAAIRLRAGELDAAVQAAERALALDPECGRAHYAEGEALRRQGRFADAKQHLALGARGSVQFERWLRLAQCLEQSDAPSGWEEGVAAARRALELMPVMLDSCDPRVELLADDPEAPRTLARLYERQGKRAKAALLFLRAYLLQVQAGTRWRRGTGEPPRALDGRDLFAVARLHEELGLPREAIVFYRQAGRFPDLAAEAEAHVARVSARLGGR